jgi:hypothetical protein
MVAMIMVIMAMVIVKMVTVRLVFMLVKEHGDSVVRLVKTDAMIVVIVVMVKRLSLTSTTAIILNIKLLS